MFIHLNKVCVDELNACIVLDVKFVKGPGYENRTLLSLLWRWEDIMGIKVLTARKFREGTTEEACQLLAQLRAAGTVRPGYISGHTLTSLKDPRTLLVISSWTDT